MSLQSAGRCVKAVAAGQASRQQRTDPERPLQRPRHVQAGGDKAPCDSRGGQPRHHVQACREKLHYLNPLPIHQIGERWIKKFERGKLVALSELKRQLEKRDE